MHSVWQSLAWREWHEHKWKLVSITAIVWGVAAFVLVSGKGELSTVDLLLPVLQICLVPLAVFVGLGVAAGERSRGTLAFTQALPAPMGQIAVWKLLMGFATLAAPILLTVAVVFVGAQVPLIRDQLPQLARTSRLPGVTGNAFVDITMISISLAGSFYVWAAAFGVHRKDEVSAGAVAIAVMVGWCMLLTAMWYAISATSPFRVGELTGRTAEIAFKMLAATAPGGFVISFEPYSGGRSYGWMAGAGAVALVIHLSLLYRYVTRFGRLVNLDVVSPKAATEEWATSPWLGKPFASSFSAIAWKQFRESVPLVVVGLAGVCGIVLLYVLQALIASRLTASQLADVVIGTSVPFGFFVAVVIGIGVCLNDGRPDINTFWRSRPISSDAWFWTKFATGLCVLLSAQYMPLAGVLWVLHPAPTRAAEQYNLALCVVVQVAIYAAAVMTTSLVRHAVYAAILSMAVVYAGVLCGLGAWFVAGLAGWVPLNPHGWLEPEGHLPAIAGMLLSAVTSTIVAWLAVRRDWGWKSRY